MLYFLEGWLWGMPHSVMISSMLPRWLNPTHNQLWMNAHMAFTCTNFDVRYSGPKHHASEWARYMQPLGKSNYMDLLLQICDCSRVFLSCCDLSHNFYHLKRATNKNFLCYWTTTSKVFSFYISSYTYYKILLLINSSTSTCSTTLTWWLHLQSHTRS